jgi:hypothetical protein
VPNCTKGQHNTSQHQRRRLTSSKHALHPTSGHHHTQKKKKCVYKRRENMAAVGHGMATHRAAQHTAGWPHTHTHSDRQFEAVCTHLKGSLTCTRVWVPYSDGVVVPPCHQQSRLHRTQAPPEGPAPRVSFVTKGHHLSRSSFVACWVVCWCVRSLNFVKRQINSVYALRVWVQAPAVTLVELSNPLIKS